MSRQIGDFVLIPDDPKYGLHAGQWAILHGSELQVDGVLVDVVECEDEHEVRVPRSELVDQ